MKASRLLSLIVGVLFVVPAIALLVGGVGLGIATIAERDDNGFFDVNIEDVTTDTVAVTAEELDLDVDPGSPDWVLDELDVDIRLRATSADDTAVFIGIGSEADVATYLAGVAHAEITEIDGEDPVYRTRTGDNNIAPPDDQSFWVASSAGPGTQELQWEAAEGEWSVVLMNADTSPGISADVGVGIRSGAVGWLAAAMLGSAMLLTALGTGLIAFGATGAGEPQTSGGPAGVPRPLAASTAMAPSAPAAVRPHDTPVALNAALDPELSNWKWLVKWILAIPHFLVLVLLWVAFAVSVVISGITILFTGRYPRALFDFNVGVMRWSWRVQFYAGNGGVGSDRYPPFSLHAKPGDLATLDIAYPEHLSRPMVLIKWLLAIPHLIIVALLSGSTVQWLDWDGDAIGFDIAAGGGLLGLFSLIAGVVLLFTSRYPQALFDLIVGLNRWVYRVTAYVALMTDDYPPFRLDQGGNEPVEPPPPGPTATNRDLDHDIDLRPDARHHEVATF